MTNVFLVMFVAIANIYMLKIKKKKSCSQKWIIFYGQVSHSWFIKMHV